MERRDFISAGIVGGALSMASGCGKEAGGESASGKGSSSLPRIKWSLVSSFPESLDTIYGAADVLCKRVGQLTNDRFRIEIDKSTKGGTQVLQMVREGSTPIGHSASYYYRGVEEALVFDTAVPFGLTARQQTAWLEKGGGREILQENVFDKLNIHCLTGGNTGTQMGGWFRKEIKNLADLKGLVMRIPGLGGVVMSRLGVTALSKPGGETYTDLERGVIQAAEWVGPYDDQKLGFHDIAKFYYYPGFWEPGPSLSFYINKKQWDRLPPAYQAALEVSASEASTGMMAAYDAQNPAALKNLRDTHGVKVIPFPDDVLAKAKEVSAAMMEEFAAKDETFKTVHAHWAEFKAASDAWFATAEQGYQKLI